MNWPRVALKRVARLGTGHTPSRKVPDYWQNCTIPWLTLADIWRLRDDTCIVIGETSEKLSDLGLANSAAVLHPAGTVALSRTASVGFSCILGTDMATSQDFVTWTCGDDLLPRYLLYILRGMRHEILGMRMGSTHQTIYMPDIERITIPFPSLPIQSAVVDFLDAEVGRLDELAALKLRLVNLIEYRRIAAHEQIISEQGIEPRKARRLLTRIGSGKTPTGGAEVYSTDGIRFIRSQNVLNGTLDLTDAVWITRATDAEMASTRLRPGDVLLNITGGSIGRSALVPADLGPANVNQHVCILRPREGEVSAELLQRELQSQYVQDQIRVAQPGGNRDGLNFEQVGDLRVRIPTHLDDQIALVNRLANADNHHRMLGDRLREQVALLREHRHALIAAVVTGELDVTKDAA